MKEGLFYPNGSFVSRGDIMRKAARDAVKETNVKFVTPLHVDARDFNEWSDIFVRRQKERLEGRGIPEHIEIDIETDKPIALIPFGDVHGGGEDVDYELFTKEAIEVASTPNAYVLTLGDLTDSYFWGKAAQDEVMGAYAEQNKYMRATLRMFADQKKLLASWAGDHDNWSSQMGENAYIDYGKKFGAYYLEGVSYISLKVGEQLYRISAAHRHRGYSIYNKAHPSIRLFRDSGEGSDICLTAHFHRKAYLSQSVKRFGGDNELVHFLSTGAYKKSDSYSRKLGLGRLNKDELGPQVLILHPHKKEVHVSWTVKEGLKMLDLMK